jgi:hypothetical protein
MNLLINNSDDFGNDWGFYVDIETSYLPNNNYEIIKTKNISYEDEYNKKMEMEYKKMEKVNSYCHSFSSLIFRISSTTLATAAISYCLLCLL